MATFITIPGGKIKRFRGRFPGHNTCSRAKMWTACGGNGRSLSFVPSQMIDVDPPDLKYQPWMDTSNGVSCGPANVWPDSNGEHFISI